MSLVNRAAEGIRKHYERRVMRDLAFSATWFAVVKTPRPMSESRSAVPERPCDIRDNIPAVAGEVNNRRPNTRPAAKDRDRGDPFDVAGEKVDEVDCQRLNHRATIWTGAASQGSPTPEARCFRNDRPSASSTTPRHIKSPSAWLVGWRSVDALVREECRGRPYLLRGTAGVIFGSAGHGTAG